MQLSMFQYDIPAVLPEGVTAFPNPSAHLRPRALRLSLSVWAFDKQRTPWQLINSMQRWSSANAGQPLPNGGVLSAIRYHLHDFSPDATQGILTQAAQVMKEDLEQAKAREAEALERIRIIMLEAERAFEAGEIDWRRHDAARRKYKTGRRAILKRSETLVRDLQAAASAFSLDWAGIRGQQALTAARAETYTAMAAAVKQTPVAAAAAESEIPPEILADVAEDAGHDVRSARAAFATNGAAAKAPPIPEILVRDGDYNRRTKVITLEHSDSGLDGLPGYVNVRSERTNTVRRFSKVRNNTDAEGETTSTDYTDGEGITLRILND